MKANKNFKISYKILIGFIIASLTSGMAGYFTNRFGGNDEMSIFVVLLSALAIGLVSNTIVTPYISKPIINIKNILGRINSGEKNITITSEEESELGDLSKAFNILLNNITEQNELIKEAEKVIGAMSFSDYTVEMTGNYNGEAKNLKEIINSLRLRLVSVQDGLIRVAHGDTSRLEEFKKIGKRSENDKMMPAVISIMETIYNLIDEVSVLTKNGIEGKLNVRGNVDKFQGDYRNIIQGINGTLDAILNPLNEVNYVLSKMAVNDFTQNITGKYKGEFKELTNSVNNVHKRLSNLIDVLIDISNGDISKLGEWKAVGKRSEQDKITPSVVHAMETIRSLIDEIGILTGEAVQGNLDARGNAIKFTGGYREIIEGINKTLNTIVEPIKEAIEVLHEMDRGNLHASVKGNYKGDHKKIKDSLNSTIESFNQVLNNINFASEQVASGARQVSSSTQLLSQGSTEQASSIEQLTASVEQISAQTKQNAENASEANELALKAKIDATKGNEQMKDMLKSMNEINESSSSISKIIKVIDEIAFQTNILALNAAVEAARAGQHGKGFAVVAEEVRNLAARSANAAKETTMLIEGSIEKVEIGTKIANDTASALNTIVDTVSKNVQLVAEIANASNEQAAGIAQVNQGIIEVSQVVQANSATAEENASSSEELSGQAELLKGMVGRFKLKKADSKHNEFEQLNPEVLAMIENMGGKNKMSDFSYENNSTNNEKSSKPQIILSDNEFGKY